MKKLILSSLLMLLSIGSPALAWNKAGHMVSGAIAYAELQKTSPKSLARVVALLREHPYYQSQWQAKIAQEAPDDPDLFLFMLAARWADDARKGDDDRPTWHYINFPFVLGSANAKVPSVPTDGSENILTALKQNRAVLDAPGANANKAVALAWIFHLTGDIHQPLHNTKAISDRFPLPEGDRGGTRFYIRAKAESRSTISLHKYWDDLILGSTKFRSVRNRSISLRQNPDYQRVRLSELSEKSYDRWGRVESYQLAPRIYQGLESGDKNNGVALPIGYSTTAKAIAERRIMLSGYRLADYLKAKF
jgi:S1/P1 Nuclease